MKKDNRYININLICTKICSCLHRTTYEFCDNGCTLATLGSESSALRIGNALLRNLRVWFFISALRIKFANDHFNEILHLMIYNLYVNSYLIYSSLTKDTMSRLHIDSLDSAECSLYLNHRRYYVSKQFPSLASPCYLLVKWEQLKLRILLWFSLRCIN